ncbi:hypothetical protein [Spirosoma endbachense]|uniref:Uncharacterized protein n=1 Tax=Spirosoma endbachense TaxID=2666025 RepID=A0A6P1VT65_9BACT|nr:hypothetical protein [Spirosoma endbachense]QHV96283.1 hypothetical protein GJR95_15220 [Spirosoma endbachense]
MPLLPTLEQQFLTQFYEPAMKNRHLRSIPERFDWAKERYELVHSHQLPFSLATFKRILYKKG